LSSRQLWTVNADSDTGILVREAYAMLERGFHEEKIPPAET
jgi:hypothetical protein